MDASSDPVYVKIHDTFKCCDAPVLFSATEAHFVCPDCVPMVYFKSAYYWYWDIHVSITFH